MIKYCSTTDRRMTRRTRILCLAGIGLLSLFLNMFHNDFPMRYHPDERKKVRFVLRERADFKHPILMIQINRLCNSLLKYNRDDDVLRLGRTVNAAAGAITVLLLFLLARKIMDEEHALLTSLAAAVSPILVVHAHYFKEDTILAAVLVPALMAFLWLAERPSPWSAILLGILSGLAVSSHYKGVLLFLVFALAPLVDRRLRIRRYPILMIVTVLLAAMVFLTINYTMMFRLRDFGKGLEWSMTQAVHGHHLKTYVWQPPFLFHLLYSLIPGMTWPAALCGIVALAYCLYRYRSMEGPTRLLLLFTSVFYLAVEISPMKDYPGFMRYVIPVVPLLLLLSCRVHGDLRKRCTSERVRLLLLSMVAVTLLVPAWTSARLVWHLRNETRDRIAAWVASCGCKVFRESYTGEDKDADHLTDVNMETLRTEGYRYLLSSSFMYERFAFGNRLKNQDPFVYDTYRRYEHIFSFPYVEIGPAFKTFALSNPTIRIIDIGPPLPQDAAKPAAESEQK